MVRKIPVVLLLVVIAFACKSKEGNPNRSANLDSPIVSGEIDGNSKDDILGPQLDPQEITTNTREIKKEASNYKKTETYKNPKTQEDFLANTYADSTDSLDEETMLAASASGALKAIGDNAKGSGEKIVADAARINDKVEEKLGTGVPENESPQSKAEDSNPNLAPALTMIGVSTLGVGLGSISLLKGYNPKQQIPGLAIAVSTLIVGSLLLADARPDKNLETAGVVLASITAASGFFGGAGALYLLFAANKVQAISRAKIGLNENPSARVDSQAFQKLQVELENLTKKRSALAEANAEAERFVRSDLEDYSADIRKRLTSISANDFDTDKFINDPNYRKNLELPNWLGIEIEDTLQGAKKMKSDFIMGQQSEIDDIDRKIAANKELRSKAVGAPLSGTQPKYLKRKIGVASGGAFGIGILMAVTASQLSLTEGVKSKSAIFLESYRKFAMSVTSQ